MLAAIPVSLPHQVCLSHKKLTGHLNTIPSQVALVEILIYLSHYPSYNFCIIHFTSMSSQFNNAILLLSNTITLSNSLSKISPRQFILLHRYALHFNAALFYLHKTHFHQCFGLVTNREKSQMFHYQMLIHFISYLMSFKYVNHLPLTLQT